MFSIHVELSESLKTGFIDHFHHSRKEYLPQLLVNDTAQSKKILTTIHKELKECEEFWFSVAFVTKSGVATIINLLKELNEKGIKSKFLVSQYLNFTQPQALRTLLKFENIDLRILVGGRFHAKGYLFKKNRTYNLIIGSSNLTDNALCVNKEWNLMISATDNSYIIKNTLVEFQREFESATKVDFGFIDSYDIIYQAQRDFYNSNESIISTLQQNDILPNKMQFEALKNLDQFRAQNINKALLISATGTGKTYLSAFDVKKFNPKRFLFIVHRGNIAEAALKSFRKIFKNDKLMGMYSGNQKEIQSDFLFSTIQTISRDEHLLQFNRDHFDYIVIDETHRAGAVSYQKILNYFKPRFLLGMTATPERMDGFDIFKQFDYNIAYEIRLHKALEEQMLSTFHYYGIADVSVNGQSIEEDAAFNLLIAEERVNRIIDKATFYGCDNGPVRGLVFCSKVHEANLLSQIFNEKGYKTIALSGDNTENERATAITKLESKNDIERIDYIFTVDIFNEGIDIPSVNQIIMLRPTQSAIVFVQQLGRGLRKTEGKDYLTVIDFIGNYTNNYLVPIALFGDTSYNKDRLRKLISTGSSLIPGASTVDFDPITRDRIFASIDSAKMSNKRDLDKDYELLKYQIGRRPMMIDFIKHGARDPYLYVEYAGSYFNYLVNKEAELSLVLSTKECKLLELFSIHIANAKRIEEAFILKSLLANHSIKIDLIVNQLINRYQMVVSEDTILSCIQNINFHFVNDPQDIIKIEDESFIITDAFASILNNHVFYVFLTDALDYAESTFNEKFNMMNYLNGFMLYEKYKRKDVHRILNWDKNPNPQNVGGYMVHPKKTSCPIFVTYNKNESISDSIKYDDKFLNNYEFEWISKNRRTLHSPDIAEILNHKNGLRLPLFIKKSNDEGSEFYYMGDMKPKENSIKQDSMTVGDKKFNIVKIIFDLSIPVEDSIFEYITS